MAPNFIGSYSKDLAKKPVCISETLIDQFYHLSAEGDLLKVTEFALSGSEMVYYSEIVSMGCSTPNFYVEYSDELKQKGSSTEQIIKELLSLDMHNEDEDCLIGRVAYNDFEFIDGNITKVGKQIKGIAILNEYRQVGIARQIYRYLLLKHYYIVCDQLQTIAGGSLWVSGMTTIGTVRIYDTIKKIFVDSLTPYGDGKKGVIPWSAEGLSQTDMAMWEPRKLSLESCYHIVNIISRDDLYPFS